MTEIIDGQHAFGCTCPGCTNTATPDPDAISLDPFAGGTYADKPIWTVDQIVENLNRTGYNWYDNNYGALGGTDKTLTYGFWNSFRDLANSYYLNDAGTVGFSEVNINTFSSFTAGQRALAVQSLALWDDLISIKIKEVNGKTENADITFGNTDTGGAQAYAYLPFGDIYDDAYQAAYGPWQVGKLGGDVWIDGFVPSNFFPLGPSYYSQTTMVHELGHALGLSHPGDYDALDDDDGDGVPDPITYANDAAFAQDSLQYSIMSYFDAYETGAQHIDWSLLNFAYAATPLVHDVATIQALYGADMTTRTGDTVYGFNSTADRVEFDFTRNTRPIVTIWDAGGTDTLDFSGWRTPSLINLNEGAFSNGGGIEQLLTLEEVNANRAALGFAARTQAQYDAYMALYNQLGLDSPLFTDNISIAYGAVIENAVGGAGDDTIVVNQVANAIDGGAGVDTVSYETATAGARIGLDGVAGTGGARGDTLVNVENLTGSAFNDVFTGDTKSNVLDGAAGNDRLTGGGNADTFLFHTADAASGADRITDFGGGDVLVTDVKIADRALDRSAGGAVVLDATDGDKVIFENADFGGLRFLGRDESGFYYGDLDVRPTASTGQKVFEGVIADDAFAGSKSAKNTDIFFYDTDNAAPTSGNDTVIFTARDLFVTTAQLEPGATANAVSLDNGLLELTGHGGTVRFQNGNGAALGSLEYDGSVTQNGVTYYVYSTAGSAVGVGDLHFGSVAATAFAPTSPVVADFGSVGALHSVMAADLVFA